MNRVVTLLLILLFVFSCDNEEDAINELEETEPAITEIGEPTGDAVTKEIGPAGGIISSGDGKLDVSVPAGAVTANTVFSIQPITNFCPGGRHAYRLLPDGLTFANPVTLTFHYTDEEIANTLIDFLGIAFQSNDRIWYLMPAEVDNSAKTISTRARHFTDWSILSQLWISPTVPYLPEIEGGESLGLELIGFDPNSAQPTGTASPASDEDDLPSLPTPSPFRAQWLVNGVIGNTNVGKIVIVDGSNNTKVRYEAPASAPANNPVAVSAKLTGKTTWDFVNKRRKTFNEVIVFKHIKIRDEYNYTLKIEDTLLEYLVCAIPQLSYLDGVEMDVKVKGANVTVSNISNNPPTIIPSQSPSGFCTIKCDPGATGSLNVSNGSGYRSDVRDAGDGYHRFNLHLKNDFNFSDAHMTLSCPNIEDLKSGAGTGEANIYYTFILSDEVQTIKNPGLEVTLTPKE